MRAAAADVVVVGAGLSGLVAARETSAAGLSTLVLEGSGRVGGRLLTRTYRGVALEMGGQWVGPRQRRVLRLAEGLGVGTVPVHEAGRTVLVEGGRRSEYEGEVPPLLEAGAFEEADGLLKELGRWAREVPAGAPWTAGRAREWDGETLESLKRRRIRGRSARFWFDLAVRSLYAAEPEELSVLGVLSDIAATGSYDGLLQIEASVEEATFAGGAQELCVRLEEELDGRVLLETPVRRVVRDGPGVVVEADGLSVEAGAAIIAVPPSARGRIDHAPSLPAAWQEISRRVPMGAVVKCHAVYERPFWRERGLSGRAESDEGPCRVVVDNSPPDGGAGVLTGFVLGRDARSWERRDAGERERAVVGCFRDLFGEEASGVLHYAEFDWTADPWAGGGYGGTFPPGVLTGYGRALREPVGRVHWAGTETAAEWNGYMEGAVEAGVRAARGVVAESENGAEVEATQTTGGY